MTGVLLWNAMKKAAFSGYSCRVMPEMNGRNLAEKIISLYPEITLLFMSGYTADIIANQGVLNEGVAFIQKPFSMAKMTEKVRELRDMAYDKC